MHPTVYIDLMMMRPGLLLQLLILTVLATALLPAAVRAQESRFIQRMKDAPDKNYLSLSYENDLIGNGSDRFYTSGVRATWFNVNTPVPAYMQRLADQVPGLTVNDTTSTFFTLGQNIFTPGDIRVSTPQPDDRPWAGFLYGSAGIGTLEDHHYDELELTLGVVGPQALGEQTQTFIHNHVTGSPVPRGWSHQLSFEPGVILSWQRRWPWGASYRFNDFMLRAEPNINASLGNVYTYAGTGLTFTLGPYQSYLQDTPPRVRPAMPGSGFFETPDQGWSWFLFAGLDGRAVARNIFLDGNSFRDSARVDKKPLVGDASAGVALTFGGYRLSYSYNFRSKEFYGQDGDSAFGSLTLTTRF